MAQVFATSSASDTPQPSETRSGMDSHSDDFSMDVDFEDSPVPSKSDDEILGSSSNQGDDDEISQLLENKLLFSDEEGDDDEEDNQDQERQAANADKPTAFDQRMRKYQLELAQPALEGKNVVISAPTGSGKTRVAMYIVRKHLEQAAAGKGRVAFMARTVPLVTQQYKGFKEHLPEYRTLKVSGDTDLTTDLPLLLSTADIFVLTPQVLLNHLELKTLKSLSESFSLLVLDECHHTRKDAPYNRIMVAYLKEKYGEERRQLPQVVGLTASLGVGKARSEAEAEDAIIGTLASMDVTTIVTVQQHKEELQQLVPVPTEEMETMVERPRDPAKDEIEKIMKKLEDRLIDKFDDFDDDELGDLMWKMPKARDSVSYRDWVAKVTKAVIGQQAESVDLKILALEFNCITEYLAVCHTALQINDRVRVRDAIQYLEKKLTPQRSDATSPEIEKDMRKQLPELQTLLKMRDDPDLTNPKLDHLEQKLAALVRAKGSDSRIIIFASTRATCRALADWVNNDLATEELRHIKAEAFVGCGELKDDEGMSQTEQERVLSKFRSGDVKLLVATSVAEEGLDIPECNIVIRYDRVGSEISTIQMRGRARKIGGTSLLIGGSATQQKEMLNLVRLELMDHAIAKIQALPQSELGARIKAKHDETLKKEEIKEVVRSEQASNKREGDFEVVCCRCRLHVAHSSNIVRVKNDHHVVRWENMEAEFDIRPLKKSNRHKQATVMCRGPEGKGCNNQVGSMMQFEGVRFPALRLAGLIFRHSTPDIDQPMYKRWSDVPYYIEDIGPQHFKLHLQRGRGSQAASTENK